MVYLPQPVQTLVARGFGVPLSESAAPNVAILAGYALGLFFLAPLRDRVPARRQAPLHVLMTAIAIAAAAAAPNFTSFVIISFLIGGATTVGQILISAALRDAPPSRRASTAAVLSGSFIVGLFTTRAAVGALADVFGWRVVFIGFAIVVISGLPIVLWAAPRAAASPETRYLVLLRSMPTIFRSSETLRSMTLTQNTAFAAFIGVWSSVTVLAVDGLKLPVSEAALLALPGLAGGITTILLARLHPRLGVRRALGRSLLPLLAGALIVMGAWQFIPLLAVGLYLISFGLSSVQVSTQTRALGTVDPEASARANTIFMTTTFLVGAMATATSDLLARVFGYSSIGALSSMLALLALLLWANACRRGLI
ncbi:putative transporter [Leifsonia rubra CMS 76R]|nr:putative transporter [Leifsonia rubra CMS 76R]